MKSVAIIGAGITGLTAAYYLRRAGVAVSIFESSNRVGGAIRSTRREGYLAESGPNTILETSPIITQLIHDLGLESRRIIPDPKMKTRFLVRDRKMIPVPSSPFQSLSTKLFSLKAKLAILREPFVSKCSKGKEESIADFVLRRLGSEFLDYAIDPMVGGIYAGDPSKLSVKHAFPKLMNLESEYGSLIMGAVLGASKRRKSKEVAKDRAQAFSFDEGLDVLPKKLAEVLGDAIQLNASIQKISRTQNGWKLEILNGKEKTSVEFDAVIYAGSAFKLPMLCVETEEGRLNLDAFSEIRHPPVSSVVLGYRREDVTHSCMGFGVLVPKVENFNILGTIFSSSLFSNRAPEGGITLTSYLGGERDHDLASLSSEELFEITHRDLSVLLGIKGEPIFRHHSYYPEAIPQYNLGYDRFHNLMEKIEKKAPNFYFAGTYRDGISLGDAILSGRRIAAHLEQSITSNFTA